MRFGGREERFLKMKNVSVRYLPETKKIFITRHRNDPRKILEKTEATNNVLNEILRLIADYEKDGSLLTFKANNTEFGLVVLTLKQINEIQSYFEEKQNKLKVNVAPIVDQAEIKDENIITDNNGD